MHSDFNFRGKSGTPAEDLDKIKDKLRETKQRFSKLKHRNTEINSKVDTLFERDSGSFFQLTNKTNFGSSTNFYPTDAVTSSVGFSGKSTAKKRKSFDNRSYLDVMKLERICSPFLNCVQQEKDFYELFFEYFKDPQEFNAKIIRQEFAGVLCNVLKMVIDYFSLKKFEERKKNMRRADHGEGNVARGGHNRGYNKIEIDVEVVKNSKRNGRLVKNNRTRPSRRSHPHPDEHLGGEIRQNEVKQASREYLDSLRSKLEKNLKGPPEGPNRGGMSRRHNSDGEIRVKNFKKKSSINKITIEIPKPDFSHIPRNSHKKPKSKTPKIMIENCNGRTKEEFSRQDSAGKLKRRATGNLGSLRNNSRNEEIDFDIDHREDTVEDRCKGVQNESPLVYSDDENFQRESIGRKNSGSSRRFKKSSKDLFMFPTPVGEYEIELEKRKREMSQKRLNPEKVEMHEIPEIELSKESSIKQTRKDDLILYPCEKAQNVERAVGRMSAASRKSTHTQTSPEKRKRKSKKKKRRSNFENKWGRNSYDRSVLRRKNGMKSTRVKKRPSGEDYGGTHFFSSRNSSTSSLRNFDIRKSNIKKRRRAMRGRGSNSKSKKGKRKQKTHDAQNSFFTKSSKKIQNRGLKLVDSKYKGSFGTEIRSLVGRILEDDKDRVYEDQLEISRARESVIEGSKAGSRGESSLKKKKKNKMKGVLDGRHLNWGNNVDPMLRHQEKRHFFDQDQFLQTHKIFPADLGLR